jgi:translation initiation factor 4G
LWSLNQKFGFQQHPDRDSPVVVDLKVRGLLNKLHIANFDSISDQIITWANKSERERDGRTLIQVICLVFEKVLDEEMWSRTYGRLCQKMMEQISLKVQDESIKNAEGKPIAGGQLFRKYLLNRCQEGFKCGWEVMGDATKPVENKSEDGTTCGHVLYSDEYYALQKTKRQGLGLMKFLAKLFMLQMLTQRIMHKCVKKLLNNIRNKSEEEISSLCKHLSTAGHVLDTNKARAHMDVHFSHMKDLARNKNVHSRMKILLLVRIF